MSHSMNPWLSVIIPTYNGQKFITTALKSVQEQNDANIELVVVDDGSVDCTLSIVRELGKHLPIRLVTPGRIGNWVAISNLGLQEAKGEWACFLHQDDLWLPGRIASIRHEIECATGALVLHNARFVGPDGQNLGPWTCPLPEGDVPPALFIERLLIQNFIAMPSPVFRREVVIRSGGLDEELWYTADWDLWLRLGSMGPVRFIAKTLSAFRIHLESQTLARKLRSNEWEVQLNTVLDRHIADRAFATKLSSSTQKVARLSIAVNSALAAASRGDRVKVPSVVFKLLALGPKGWRVYLRDSRILQRARSRLKLRGLIGNI